MSAINLPQMHRHSSQRLAEKNAIKYRCGEDVRGLSWTEYRLQADWVAAGLAKLGVQLGDRVSLFSENRYEWLIADHGMLSCGATTVPLHAPLAPVQVAYQLGHSESSGIILSNADQAAKLASVIDQLPELKFVISFDPVPDLPRVKMVTWDQLLEDGRSVGAGLESQVIEMESKIAAGQLATLIYTSGTTGNPKGVMLTHDNLLTNAIATESISEFDESDVLLSWLPYSHIYARTVDHYMTNYIGATICLSASVDNVLNDLQEYQPTWLTSVPRLYEKVWDSVATMPKEQRAVALKHVFGPKIRQLSSGGAPLPRQICEGFFEAGIPLYEGYGLTESSPVISFNSEKNNRIGSVGKAIPGIEVRIDNDGEILTRGPHVMKGYWRNAEATQETISGGWLRTGDVGELDDDGFLKITDRKKDLIITSGGKNIAPSELERLMIKSPLIDQAVAYGDGRSYVSALIFPALDLLKKKVEEQGWTLTEGGKFYEDEAVVACYEAIIEELMANVSQPERVKKILIVATPLSVEAEELTATLKVRRRHVISKYEEQLAKLY